MSYNNLPSVSTGASGEVSSGAFDLTDVNTSINTINLDTTPQSDFVISVTNFNTGGVPYSITKELLRHYITFGNAIIFQNVTPHRKTTAIRLHRVSTIKQGEAFMRSSLNSMLRNYDYLIVCIESLHEREVSESVRHILGNPTRLFEVSTVDRLFKTADASKIPMMDNVVFVDELNQLNTTFDMNEIVRLSQAARIESDTKSLRAKRFHFLTRFDDKIKRVSKKRILRYDVDRGRILAAAAHLSEIDITTIKASVKDTHDLKQSVTKLSHEQSDATDKVKIIMDKVHKLESTKIAYRKRIADTTNYINNKLNGTDIDTFKRSVKMLNKLRSRTRQNSA